MTTKECVTDEKIIIDIKNDTRLIKLDKLGFLLGGLFVILGLVGNFVEVMDVFSPFLLLGILLIGFILLQTWKTNQIRLEDYEIRIAILSEATHECYHTVRSRIPYIRYFTLDFGLTGEWKIILSIGKRSDLHRGGF